MSPFPFKPYAFQLEPLLLPKWKNMTFGVAPKRCIWTSSSPNEHENSPELF